MRESQWLQNAEPVETRSGWEYVTAAQQRLKPGARERFRHRPYKRAEARLHRYAKRCGRVFVYLNGEMAHQMPTIQSPIT
jgi:hypothetical protein